ncbi:MAG: hypothetical protein HXY36_04330 [Chloroflexi bacterium]|nr:hypothetical protein [Chloroflexota bacterium]
MNQIEVKYHIIEKRFHPSDGWNVTVDLDPMEMGKGRQNAGQKGALAQTYRKRLEDIGVRIGADKEFGRTDIVARHPEKGCFIIECEGDTRKQKEQAMYSALGQLLVKMFAGYARTCYGLAVPKSNGWRKQLSKIPKTVCQRLNLKLYLVSGSAVQELTGSEQATGADGDSCR